MLESIFVNNFKSLERVDLQLKRINVFIGPNGAGKSSVAQALLVFKQSLRAEREVRLNGDYIKLGGFKDVLYSKSTVPEIVMGISGRAEHRRFAYNIVFDETGLIAHEAEIKGDYTLHGAWARERELMQQKPEPSRIVDNSDPTVVVSLGCFPSIGEPFRSTGGSQGGNVDSPRVFQRLQRSLDSFLTVIGRSLGRVYLVPGIRGIDKFQVELQDSVHESFQTAEGASKQASYLASVTGYDPDILDKVSEWLKFFDEKDSRIRHRNIPRTDQNQTRGIALEVVRPHATINIINEGLRLNQLVFPLAVLAKSPRDSLIAIEEPEIHLHPRFQSRFMDLLADVSRIQEKQLLLTTHSEHVLFRFLTQIARRQLSKEDLAVYYFNREGLATKAKKLEVTDDGQIKGGMPGFFEEELEQFREYIDALAGTKNEA
jgi:predicted ATPase